jgi:hypothetical protein
LLLPSGLLTMSVRTTAPAGLQGSSSQQRAAGHKAGAWRAAGRACTQGRGCRSAVLGAVRLCVGAQPCRAFKSSCQGRQQRRACTYPSDLAS